MLAQVRRKVETHPVPLLLEEMIRCMCRRVLAQRNVVLYVINMATNATVVKESHPGWPPPWYVKDIWQTVRGRTYPANSTGFLLPTVLRLKLVPIFLIVFPVGSRVWLFTGKCLPLPSRLFPFLNAPCSTRTYFQNQVLLTNCSQVGPCRATSQKAVLTLLFAKPKLGELTFPCHSHSRNPCCHRMLMRQMKG
jgi:hypothetical protein